MKFKSLIYAQASGSVGGLTYAHNKAGLYVRGRSLVTNSATPLQQVLRNGMVAAQEAWKALTAQERTDWAAYAAGTPIVNSLGDSMELTGLTMFLRQYLLRVQNAVAQITAAPTTPGLTEVTIPTLTRHLATNTFDFAFTNTDPWAITTGGFLALYLSSPRTPTVNFFKGPYRYIGHVLGNTATPPTSPANFTVPYTVASGQRYFARTIAVDSEGRLSGHLFLSLDIA